MQPEDRKNGAPPPAGAWSGRFSEPVDRLTQRYTASVSFDRRLAEFDILGSLAHARMLSRCGILPKVAEPVDLYTLTPKTTYPEDLPDVDWQLVVEKPVAAATIDTTRIAVQRGPYSIEYFARASWSDHATVMVQTLLIESFESTGKIVAVGREAVGLRPDYILKTDLREFEAVYADAEAVPDVLVRMNAKLVQMPERKIVASKTVEKRVTAEGTAFTDVIAAFDTALGRTLKEVVVFTLTAPGAG